MQLIRPKRLDFYYTFTKDECYKELSGTCSLENPNHSSNQLAPKKRAKRDYCQNLYNHLRNNEDFNSIDPIEISQYSCGHYEIHCGRHRICICQKTDLTIRAMVTNEDEKCYICLEIT